MQILNCFGPQFYELETVSFPIISYTFSFASASFNQRKKNYICEQCVMTDAADEERPSEFSSLPVINVCL